MNRIARLLVLITALAVLASACGGADDEAAEAPSTTEAPVASDGDGESAETGDAPTTSAAPTTTEAPPHADANTARAVIKTSNRAIRFISILQSGGVDTVQITGTEPVDSFVDDGPGGDQTRPTDTSPTS